MNTLRIGCGAGYSGDRIDPAVELAEKGDIAYLVFECLAERTIAIAQKARLTDPVAGYDPLLEERMRAVLPICAQKHIRIISNMGAANPPAAAEKTRDIAQQLGHRGLRIAAVTGDDVLETLRAGIDEVDSLEGPLPPAETWLSANAYLGVAPIIEALRSDADIILTGRVADPALFLAPLVHEFRWSLEDWELLGKGTAVGHLLECAGQLTGGYFGDPGVKDVPDLDRLGFPIAEVSEDGSAVLTKIDGSGGVINAATCTEQLLYEIQDPAAYYTPDVVADFSGVAFSELGRDRVSVSGAAGRMRPSTLKVSIGYRDGYIGEGQISYAGPNALARAELARDILAKRLAGLEISELRFDFIGLNSIHGTQLSRNAAVPHEVRLRAAGRASSLAAAAWITREVEALYTNGPAGGGGASGSAREVIAIASALIPRDAVSHRVQILES
ncbi:acyclic terpene utilization AtuA family protein [Occallatibacter savannae]|uniref:acyclic terpene utilization AtuA family protein n=1 Tax=Occallatibacter savannae TaxID=1002691 RepID=UPI000D69894C|nr:acyclic terpene utilization AtuA family protein [Occallatibacter savannae]